MRKSTGSYKKSFNGMTIKIEVLERGKVVDRIAVCDTVQIKQFMDKYA